MTKPYQTLIPFVTTLFLILSLLHPVQSAGKDSHFSVQGQVYCDVCRAQFMTKPCHYLKGATVRLECRNREQDTNLTFKGEATTDDSGTYHISVDGKDFEDDICEVKLVKSPESDCSEVSSKKSFKDVARVSLAANSGMASDVRLANPLGFMKKQANPECKELLDEMGVAPQT